MINTNKALAKAGAKVEAKAKTEVVQQAEVVRDLREKANLNPMLKLQDPGESLRRAKLEDLSARTG